MTRIMHAHSFACMKHADITPNRRQPVNVSLDTGIVEAARKVGINLSRVTEAALRVAVKEAQERQWREDNRAGIEQFNAWYAENGDPLAHLPAL
ncbi:type II toxin-antitoxin system CcdA family antitoxin [Sphingomonas sp. 1P08PE]|uniref:type II toxin-antitoxin system CcdA family antitoxin n=1 Tax=Sphingomonas sp. 1P08PE TaxID=554122 RepID=UPI0039A04CF3